METFYALTLTSSRNYLYLFIQGFCINKMAKVMTEVASHIQRRIISLTVIDKKSKKEKLLIVKYNKY